jgi:hypothetical protein
VSTQHATAPTGAQAAVDIPLEHGNIAVQNAQDALDAGDSQPASIRLLEAAQLNRLAARELDPEIQPTGILR